MPFKKGEGGRHKGSLNKETLTKLERRAYFEKRAAEKFDEWIDKVRPEYGLDQFLGKATDIVEVREKKEPSARLKALAEMLKNADRNKDKSE